MNAATHDMFGLQNKILQNMVEGVLLTRVSDAVIIFANPRFETLFGYQKGELIGKNVSILDAPEGKSPEAQASEIQNRLKKTGVWQGEIRTIKKDGTPLWCRIKVSTFDHSEYGTVLIGVYEDITERKKAQDALRLRESYLTAIIENQPGLVWLKDRDGKFLAVNNSFAKSCNLDDPRLLLGKTDFDICPHELAAQYVADDNRVIKSGKPYLVEEPISDRGDIRWFETFKTPIWDKQGLVIGTTGYARDITERKRTEKALLKSEEKYRNIFTNSIEGIFQSTSDGRLISANAALADILGYTSPEELIGSITDISTQIYADPTVRDRVKELLIKNGFIKNLEVQCRHKNGGLVWILLNIWRVLDDQGRLLSIEGSGQNITERKRIEEELQKTQKLESLGILAGGIAHDFNNLMTGIFSYIDLARMTSKEPQVLEYLNATFQSMSRAKALTSQLLTFAKGGMPVVTTEPLFPFVQETAQFALSGSNISCSFTVQEGLWAARIDKNQIGQVIDNLIINAQQAMPQGGAIEVSAINIPAGRIEYQILTEGPYVKISIKDQGVGIPQKILPHIFDPFFTTKSKGHGLGLATCFSIVSRHDGAIQVESEQGSGSTFHIYLPATTEPVINPGAGETPDSHASTGTFIIMDDEEDVRNGLAKMLEFFGYSCIGVKEGRAAIDRYCDALKAQEKIAGIMLDLTVPGGLGGKETISEIRTQDKNVPIFVLSGYADDPIMSNPTSFGFNASISKPFTLKDVAEVLNKHMRK